MIEASTPTNGTAAAKQAQAETANCRTPAQAEASRRNGRKSKTGGPKTAEGKAAAALNSLKHGAFAKVEIIEHAGESREEWERHRVAVMDSLQPRNYLEGLFAERVADLFWRMRRIDAYEHRRARARVNEADGLRERGDAHNHVDEASARLKALHAAADTTIPDSAAADDFGAWLLANHFSGEADAPDVVEFSGVPVVNEDDLLDFENWTVGHIRRMIEKAAAAAQRPADRYLADALAEHDTAVTRAICIRFNAEKRAEAGITRELFPQPHENKSLQASRDHLERSLRRALAEFRALRTE